MDKEQTAIERLKTVLAMSLAVYGLPLVVTTSDGKGSSVCVALAERAGIVFEVIHPRDGGRAGNGTLRLNGC